MAKVLLIYPHMRMLSPLFPYSLLPLAGSLLEVGHEVKILDAQVQDLSEFDPSGFDVIGISTLTGYQIEGALRAAEYVRSSAPAALLVWGGVHPSLTPAETIRHPLVDAVVRGEGERTLLNLVEAYEKGFPLRDVAGLTLLEDGEVFDTGDTEFIDLDELPYLPYHLIKKERYPHFKGDPSWVFYETSRGCPNNCAFCYNQTVQKRTWRCKSVSRVLDELEYILDTLGVDSVWPIDDNFSVSKKRVTEIARGMIERGRVFEWPLNSRFDYAVGYDAEFLGLLKRAGVTTISFGGESGSQSMLDAMCKGITPDMMRQSVRTLQENRIKCGVMFMAGFPGETDDDLNATLDLIDELMVIDPELEPRITIFTPFPSTEMYRDALDNGFREPGSLEAWSKFGYGIVDNCPWLDTRHKRVLRTIALVSVFDLKTPGIKSGRLLKGRRFMSLAHRLLSVSARFRWKHRFFGFAPEFRLLDLVLKSLRLWHR